MIDGVEEAMGELIRALKDIGLQNYDYVKKLDGDKG